MKRLHALALTVLLAGCDMFDPALYRKAQQLEIAADVCVEATVPVLAPSAVPVPIELSAMNDNWQVASCGASAAVGNDGFFAVDLDAGEKLHVHVNAIDAIDPAVYVVDSCDERVCQPLNAASQCAGGKEHLSFIAPRTGRYFVGVDSVDPGGGRVEVLAITPKCGDGEKEHGEPCEDGNLAGGDGCDAACRNEIAASDRLELEPNDDLASGNALQLGGASSFRVRGTLEGPCDPEVFSFDVPRAASAFVSLLDAGGAGCAAPGSGAVELVLYQGFTELARAASDAQGCVGLPATLLQPRKDASGALPAAASTYHVQLRALPTAEPIPLSYTLVIELRE